jgi:hypothetical protein
MCGGGQSGTAINSSAAGTATVGPIDVINVINAADGATLGPICS